MTTRLYDLLVTIMLIQLGGLIADPLGEWRLLNMLLQACYTGPLVLWVLRENRWDPLTIWFLVLIVVMTVRAGIEDPFRDWKRANPQATWLMSIGVLVVAAFLGRKVRTPW